MDNITPEQLQNILQLLGSLTNTQKQQQSNSIFNTRYQQPTMWDMLANYNQQPNQQSILQPIQVPNIQLSQSNIQQPTQKRNNAVGYTYNTPQPIDTRQQQTQQKQGSGMDINNIIKMLNMFGGNQNQGGFFKGLNTYQSPQYYPQSQGGLNTAFQEFQNNQLRSMDVNNTMGNFNLGGFK